MPIDFIGLIKKRRVPLAKRSPRDNYECRIQRFGLVSHAEFRKSDFGDWRLDFGVSLMPAGGLAADIDVDERPAVPGAAVPTHASGQLRVLHLQILGVGSQQPRVGPVRLAVVVLVIQPPVIVAVNDDIGGPAVDVRAVPAILHALVVRRRAVAAENNEPVELETPALHEIGE